MSTHGKRDGGVKARQGYTGDVSDEVLQMEVNRLSRFIRLTSSTDGASRRARDHLYSAQGGCCILLLQ